VEEITEDLRQEGWLDALAFLEAVRGEDYEGVETVLNNCTGYMLVSSLASMLFVSLEDRQVDVAAWIDNERRMLLGT
jgi:hypothetical protein